MLFYFPAGAKWIRFPARRRLRTRWADSVLTGATLTRAPRKGCTTLDDKVHEGGESYDVGDWLRPQTVKNEGTSL